MKQHPTQGRADRRVRLLRRTRVASAVCLCLSVLGCAAPGQDDGTRKPSAAGVPPADPLVQAQAEPVDLRSPPAPRRGQAEPRRATPTAERASSPVPPGPVIRPTSGASRSAVRSSAAPMPAAAARPGGAGNEETVTLNFVDADIPTVLRVLARFTSRNFLVDPRVKGQLTLVSEQPVPAGVALQMLQGSLRMQGFAIVESEGLTRVVPEADAKLIGGTVLGADAPAGGGGLATRTFRLSYENATNLVNVIRPMVPPNNPVTAYPGNNTLVVTDYAENLARIAQIIASIDTPTALDTDVIKIHNGIALDIAAMAADLLDAQSNDPTQRIVVVADPRSNSVVVRASSPARTQLARDLIIKLDNVQSDPGNLHVVYLRNAQALHLADVLRGLLTGESGGQGSMGGGSDESVRAALGGGGMNSGTGSASGSSAANGASASGSGSTSGSGSGMSSNTRIARTGMGGASGQNGQGGIGGQGSSSAFSAGGVTVQADASTNTLIISAPDPMYRSLRKVIDLLDQRRAQVLVESLIVEVTENDSAELGIQWMAGNGRYFGGANLSGSGLNVNAATTIDAVPRGMNIGIIDGTVNLPGVGEILNLKVLARALQTKGGANILSTPNLLTLDNEPASIMVGKTVPFVSGQYVTSGSGGSNNPFQTIQREDIGLKLNIRPQISEGGTVKLDIYQEVSSIDNNLSNEAGVVTNKRAIDTSVLLDDGQIMVLGGLLEDSVSTTTDAVPLLGSLPVLGALFRYDSRQRVKTNLMVFLRPYVVRDAQAGAGLTQDRYNFMRRTQAAVQPGRHWALPDMNAPILPPPGVPQAAGERAYDLRPESWEDTQRQEPPPVTQSSALRQQPTPADTAAPDETIRTRLPKGLTIASDPDAFYGHTRTDINVLQIADVQSQSAAEQIAQRVRISGLKAYTMAGPGGMGYVVRTDVSRDPAATDAAVQVLRELGYRPAISVGQ